MPTNLNIDDRLVCKARELGKHRTKRAAVTEALEEYVRRREQRRIVSLFGKVEYDPAYDYKKQRARR
jgi:Arc/MetJ family transcription regulator